MITISTVSTGGPTTYRPDDKTGRQAGSFANLMRQQETQNPGRGNAAVQAFNLQTFGPTIGAAVNAQGYVAIDQIRARHEEKLAAFTTELGNLFRDEGIATTPPPILEVDKAGTVTVVNEHPDKAKINALFVDRADLRRSFANLQSDATVIAAYDRTNGDSLRRPDWRVTFDGDRMRLELTGEGVGRFAWAGGAQEAQPELVANKADNPAR